MKINSIRNLIVSILISMFLIYSFVQTPDIKAKIMILPFLICGVAVACQMACLIMNKMKYIKFFKKVYLISFIIYVFGFLFYWCYLNVKTQSYGSLIFSVPFWLAGIYIIYKSFRKNKKS